MNRLIPLGAVTPYWVQDHPNALFDPEPPDGWVWCDGSPHGGPEELTNLIGPNSPDLRRGGDSNERFLLRVKP